MARKSNKTAHVLNLIAGHDAAKETDEQASIEQETSGSTGAQAVSDGSSAQAAQAASDGTDLQAAQAASDSAVSQTAQAASGAAAPQTAQAAPGQAAGQAVSSGIGTVSGAGNQAAGAVPSPIPAQPQATAVPPQNNIAMIDKTGDDPVAELIQQKLSTEFEKQIQQSGTDASAPAESGSAPESSSDLGDSSDSSPDADASADPSAGTPPEILPVSESEAVVPEMNTTSDFDAASVSEENTASVSDAYSAPEPSAENTVAEGHNTVDLTDSAPAESSVPEQAVEPTPAAVPISEDASSPDAVSPQNDAGAMEAAPAQETASSQQSILEADPEPEEPEADFAAINVMEHIVRDKIIYYMRQFDVCTCDRCKADVTALTLNGLMPKYIVTMKAAVDPLLSYYTNRLISDVTVEATKSCMTVKENPRH
jgi:competence protein ComFB